MTSLITLDNMRNSLRTETGVAFPLNSFFLNKVMDGFAQNVRALPTEQKQKEAIYALANNVAKFAAARVDFTKDFDKIDVVFRGGMPCLSTRTELLPRLLARRGYMYNDFFAAIGPNSNARFVEKLTANGRRVMIFNDDDQPQPLINQANLIGGNIEKFAIRISIGKSANEMLDFCAIVPADEVIAASNASENGLFKAQWMEVQDPRGYARKKRVVTDKPNDNADAPWVKYTSEMVKKVCVRRLQKVITETFPEIADACDLDTEDSYQEPIRVNSEPAAVETVAAPAQPVVVSWDNPTQEQAQAVNDAYESYKNLPDLMIEHLESMKADIPAPDARTGKFKAEFAEKHYATLYIFRKAKSLHEKRPDLWEDFAWIFE